MKWRSMCRRSSILIKNFFFPKSKERLGRKNKGFLTVFLFYNEHKPVKLTGKGEDRESVHKLTEVFILFLLTIPCFDCIALCIF